MKSVQICTNLNINISGTTVSLKWQDSGNTIIDKQYLCTWAGTKVVKKLGSYPTNENDGTLDLRRKFMLDNEKDREKMVEKLEKGELGWSTIN